MSTSNACAPVTSAVSSGEDARIDKLRHSIEHASHFLPSQGPITVFVHHNTLHAFEDEPFDEAVVHAGRVFGCEPFLAESRYRKELERGRIRVADLESVLNDDLGDEADRLIGSFGTRYALRLAMLQFPLRHAPDVELRWLMAETDALRRFRSEVQPSTRRQTIDQTRKWVLRDLLPGNANAGDGHDVLRSLRDETGSTPMESWPEKTWESFVLKFLWRVCLAGVEKSGIPSAVEPLPIRHRDLLLAATGQDADRLVHDVLIRFCAGFLDQGFATWEMPGRRGGFLGAFMEMYSHSGLSQPRWMRGLREALQSLRERPRSAIQCIADSLDRLGVGDDETEAFLRSTFLALRGWSGMVWQMEFNAPWAPHPAATGTFEEFLAVRLLLDRFAVEHIAKQHLRVDDLKSVRDAATRNIRPSHPHTHEQQAYVIFQLAQVRGWSPEQLIDLSVDQWSGLVRELNAFASTQRRRVFHSAYERRYRNQALDAIVAHSKHLSKESAREETPAPAFQLVCCIDDREESFRRHLEEIAPDCETFGIAGFFGVAMYYKGIGEAHYTPLCPVVVTPKHFVQEESAYSLAERSERQAAQRRRLGLATRQVHRGSRSLVGGSVAAMVGSVAAFPLVARILFPRTTSRLRNTFGSIVQPTVTQLRLERIEAEPGDSNGALGYSLDEMSHIVEGGLRALGLTKSFADLVIICGHGSASLNNPHAAAYDCGACGGGRGGPNARAFAQMANDPRVRRNLVDRSLVIPDDVIFVGSYHNTCDDSVTWFDLDRIPVTHRKLFEDSRDSIYEARERNAHERSRRFESAELTLSTKAALLHVEGRSEDLSQARPECGHATNALCFVGRRDFSRGLFLDRRAFLTSYDPTQDDARSSILEKLLQAVIPVCAGINLEYYFSHVDPQGYGSGTKLPHNVTSLLGVMDGPMSDLRTGLPWQMVEIHEPVRLLFVIETSVASMRRILSDNPPLARLVLGGWVQLSLLDPTDRTVHWLHQGEYQVYKPESDHLPTTDGSLSWYHGSRDHLGFAETGRLSR